MGACHCSEASPAFTLDAVPVTMICVVFEVAPVPPAVRPVRVGILRTPAGIVIVARTVTPESYPDIPGVTPVRVEILE